MTTPVFNTCGFALSVSDISFSIPIVPYYHALGSPIPAVEKPLIAKYLGPQ
jgi:hypothetical protein